MFAAKTPALNFEWVSVSETQALSLPSPFPTRGYYFRGENGKYNMCLSSRDRITDSEERIIKDIKTIDFELALKQFPQVYLAEKDGLLIDYTAMAQHYGLATDYLDLTYDIGVAAFFACTKFNENGAVFPTDSEYAQIRMKCLTLPDNPLDESNRLRILGMQPFSRPARQSAVCYRMGEGEDFAGECCTFVFKTDPEDAAIIANCFSSPVSMNECGGSWLFPEEMIVRTAETVKNTPCVSESAVEIYCERYDKDISNVLGILNARSVSIAYQDVKWISDEQRKQLEEELTPYPYGKNRIGARLCYKPLGES